MYNSEKKFRTTWSSDRELTAFYLVYCFRCSWKNFSTLKKIKNNAS